MAMSMSELNPDEVTQIFDELYRLSTEPFNAVHQEIEDVFAGRYRIKKEAIRPWHYEDLFAQGAPSIYAVDLDDYYKDVDIPAVASKFYSSFNMPVEDILARSDLYEKEGKSQHAFSFWIDKEDDIRILCNIVPNERWMSTMLHELGHATYDKYIDDQLPWLLREPAHPFTTEGIAMLMDRFASNAQWMDRALDMTDRELRKVSTVTRKNDRLSKLIFARWSMVVYNFERAMYENPDQNLNELWWNLVERYQQIRRPDKPVGGEWATKIHIATYPVYYQNYQLGELFASQVLSHVAELYYPEEPLLEAVFWGNEEAGVYLKENIFSPGKKYEWNKMIDRATGEKLTARHFVRIYVES
jgi:peptidyl-dipeptidase A